MKTKAMNIKRVTVYASSSRALDAIYYRAAKRLGQVLADAGLEIVYGGGGSGLMGTVADAALSGGAAVHGVIPDFLHDLEQGHQHLTSMEVVSDMRIRKQLMLNRGDAVVALPGGCGTFEELFEALTMKRLGYFLGPIILLNTNGYYDGCTQFLEQSVEQRFMARQHLAMWQLVSDPEQVTDAFNTAPDWSEDARQFCSVPALA